MVLGSDVHLPNNNQHVLHYVKVDCVKPLHSGLFNTVNFDIVKDKLESLIKKAA